MDEKPSPNMSQVRRARPLALVLLLLVFVYTLWQWPSTHRDAVVSSLSIIPDVDEAVAPAAKDKKLVPLEAHIISKCPDTRVLQCLPLPSSSTCS